MGSREFFRSDAKTPLCDYYLTAGAVCQLSTNYEPILEAARESFFQAGAPPRLSDLRLRFWVDSAAQAGPPWPKPHFRGLGQLIFAGFDSENSLLIDLRTRRAIGRFSPAMGNDRCFWKTVIFPVLLTVFGASVGITELHCACVVKNENGLLLAGDSGAGKSALSLALGECGFAFLSDDRTYISRRDGQLIAWGLPTFLKLRADASALFPELGGLDPRVGWNGERAFQVDPEHQLHFPRCLRCEPRWLIFLERQAAPGFVLTEMSPAKAAARLKEDLLPETPEATRVQLETINKLVDQQCWLVRYGGAPQSIARALDQFCSNRRKTESLLRRSE